MDLTIGEVGLERCLPSKRDISDQTGYPILHFVLDGEGQIDYGGKRQRLKRGSLFLFDGTRPISYWPSKGKPWSYLWVGIQGEPAQRYLKETLFPESHPFYVFAKGDPYYSALPLLIMASQVKKPFERQLLLKGLLLEVFALVALSQKAVAPTQEDDPVVTETMGFLRHNYYLDLSVEDIAANVGLSPRYLCRVFKKATGEGLIQALTQIRLAKSMEWLAKTALPIHEIAHKAGYRDPLYFSAVFHRKTGQYPLAYRKKAQNALTPKALGSERRTA